MVPDNISLNSDSKEIEKRILEEENIDDLNDIVKLFNISLKKRDIIRSSKLSEVQDKVVEQIASRVNDRPDNFSNDDLLKYYKTIQDTLSKSDNSLDDVKVPTIQLNQQINISEDKFDRESRKRIIDTVNQILNMTKESSQSIEDIVELKEGDIEVVENEV